VGHVYTGDRAFEGLFTERQVSAVITSAMPHCSRLMPNSKPSTHPAVPGKPDQMIAARTILAIPATSTHPHVNQLMPRFGHCSVIKITSPDAELTVPDLTRPARAESASRRGSAHP
jgi:hypothetical protein